MEISSPDFRLQSEQSTNCAHFVFTHPRSVRVITPRTIGLLSVAGLGVVLACVDSVSRVSLCAFLLTVSLVLFFPRRRLVSESVMAVRNVGLQLTVQHSNEKVQHTFIPISDIKDIVINEAPAGFIIRTYLLVIGQTRNILPFEHTHLPIKTSAQILFALRNVLFDETLTSSSCFLLCLVFTTPETNVETNARVWKK